MTRSSIIKAGLLLVSLTLIASEIGAYKRRASDVDWKSELHSMGRLGEAYWTHVKSSCVNRCQWTKLDAMTLSFEGVIATGSSEEFMRKVDDGIVEVKLNSAGGNVTEALKIAREIQRRRLNVHVDGYCISSCANYLFLAGREKRIDGLVGFHGSVQALHKYSCLEETGKRKCDDDVEEKAFFESVGISNILFEVTQSVDKGMKDKGNYAYYAPNAQTLRALGVVGLVGDQSEQYLIQMKRYYDEFGLLEFAVARDPNPTVRSRLLEFQALK